MPITPALSWLSALGAGRRVGCGGCRRVLRVQGGLLRRDRRGLGVVPGEWTPRAVVSRSRWLGNEETENCLSQETAFWEVPETPPLPKKIELLAGVPPCWPGSVCPCQYFSTTPAPAGTRTKDGPLAQGRDGGGGGGAGTCCPASVSWGSPSHLSGERRCSLGAGPSRSPRASPAAFGMGFLWGR